MREIEIKGWPHLAELCERFAIGNWIFRGVANGEYLLIPAIGRAGARRSLQNVDLPYDAKAAAEMLHRFKLRARPLVDLHHSADDLEWLSLGRHHGLPTPFLDWTTSFLVAAFFACQGGGVVGGAKRRAAIYAVQRPRTVWNAAEANASSEPVAYDPPHVSPRITAQSGLLTFHPRPDETWQPKEMVKLWIASEIAIRIKVVLTRAGVHEASVMPGLDGIAGYLGWEYKRESLVKITLKADADGSAFDHGYDADGNKQFVVVMVDDPNYKKGQEDGASKV